MFIYKYYIKRDNVQSAVQKLKTIIPRNFFYCDVGARGGIEVPWKSFKKILNLISFEPD